MINLIEKYKKEIASLSSLRDSEEKSGRGGHCLSITGKIMAYNAVISDLKRLTT